MSHNSYPTPQCGDVIFTNSKEKSSLVSRFLQKYWLDPLARTSTRLFSHVSVAIDQSCALEAVPDEPSDCPDGQKGKVAEWTGICLDHGVRLVHLADVIIPAAKNGTDFAVLRPSQQILALAKPLEVTSPDLIGLIGNAYSIDGLKTVVESAIGIALPKMIKEKFFNWSSGPEDLATKMGIDADFKAKVAKSFPNFDLKLQSASYCCSELAVDLLHRANILSGNDKFENITPTGLFNVLSHRGDEWIEVTNSDYSNDAINTMSLIGVVSFQATYASRKALIRLAQQGAASGPAIDLIGEAMRTMNEFCGETLAKLDRNRGK